MIHINLLPVREIKRRNEAKRQIIAALLAVSCFLVLLIAFAFFQTSKISSLRDTERQLKEQREGYTQILNKIKEIEDQKKIVETRIDIIHKLKQSASLTVHVLDEVANTTPARRMWLTSLAQAGSELKLSGMALDEQTIAKYMDDLARSAYIQDVKLINASMAIYAERDLKKFVISCSLGVPGAQQESAPSN